MMQRWPGVARRNKNGEVEFSTGTVMQVRPNMIRVRIARSSEYGGALGANVEWCILIGDSFPYICDHCKRTWCGWFIYKQDDENRGPCPACRAPLRTAMEGDRLKMHFRFDMDSKLTEPNKIGPKGWGNWFGEKVD